MKKNLLIICLSLTVLMMYACSKDDFGELDLEETEQTDPDTDTDPEEDPEIPEDPGSTDDDDLNPNSQSISFENAVSIAFTLSGATISNPFENKGVVVENDNGNIVITSTVSGTTLNYVLSGIIADGSVKIYGNEKFGLVLNGVGITKPDGAAINIQSKKKCTVTIIDKTNNRLIDGAKYTLTDGEDMKATFFSEGDLEFNGNGNLEIRGKYKHGLASDGELAITGGSIHIKEAASDGIHTNDAVSISGGVLTIRSTSDGIDSESSKAPISITGGDITIVTTGDKGHGVKTKQNVEIESTGKVDITTYGAASKGIKPSGDILIRKGNIGLNTAGHAIWDTDDNDISSAAGIKCDGNFLMEEGTLTVLSTGKGGKGISADGTLVINGGTVSVTTTGDQYIYDTNNDTAAKGIKSDGNLTINGGSIKIRTSRTEAEGLESKATLTITGGEVDIEAYDDGINATTHIQIDGGNIYCNSTTNDAIDSNGTLTVSGGVVIAAGATRPEAGFDCDNNRFSITGGTLIGLGGSTSSPTANSSTQRSLIFNASTTGIQVIRIEATSGGKEVLTFKLPKTYSSQMTMLFSSPALTANTGYTIYTGGSILGGSNFHGFYTGATYTKGTAAGTFTTGSAAGAVSTVGTAQGPGGGWRL